MSRPRKVLEAENIRLREALRALEWKAGNHAACLLALGHTDRAKGLTDACAVARAALAQSGRDPIRMEIPNEPFRSWNDRKS